VGSNDIALAQIFGPGLVATVLDSVQDAKNRKKEPTQEEKLRDAVSHLLGELGGLSVQEDALTFTGEKFILPAQYDGKVESAIDYLVNHIKQESQTFKFHRTMDYRPYDGAHAFMTVMKQLTGTTGLGKTKWTFFGPQHPQFLSINTSPTKVEQIPWGEVNFPMYEATFRVGATHDEDKGLVFHLAVEAPRKWRKHIEAIFSIIEKHLVEHSIYRGQAIDGAENPNFLDLSSVSEERVFYSEDVMAQLSAHVWTPVTYADTVRQLMPLKRAVLFAGPYGTGKTLGCMLTAQKAVKAGWTFVMCRTGKDDPAMVMKTAALYAPAVVVVEDIDVHAEGGTNADISRLLEMLDGITTKGVEVVGLFTTNHLDRIQKGALRPGRIDAIIEISDLDEAGFRKCITAEVTTEYLDKKIAWGEVSEAFAGFRPAFVVEAARRAQRYTMSRNEGQPGTIKTEDLVHAAGSLRPQLDLMDGAKEGANSVTVDDLLRQQIESTLRRTHVYAGADDPFVVEPYNPILKK
jgi:transitional endoplasmic reticulum ATPase